MPEPAEHPQVSTASVREQLYGGFDEQLSILFAGSGIGWHYETGIQIVRLVLAGVFDRFPGLQIITGHWGEVGKHSVKAAMPCVSRPRIS